MGSWWQFEATLEQTDYVCRRCNSTDATRVNVRFDYGNAVHYGDAVWCTGCGMEHSWLITIG